MSRRGFALCAVAVTAAVSAAASAAGPTERFAVVAPESYVTDFVPRALQPEKMVRVMLKLSADPVAVVRGRAGGKALSAADHLAALSRIKVEHDSVEPHVRAAGGRVLSRMQHAFNGMKIEVPASKVAGLAALPGVAAVLPVGVYHLDNTTSVPLIGAPAVWSGVPGYRGEGIKIAIIDTGIDYTHANFGGPGTVAAFQAAAASSTAPADPALFGCPTCRVKGGTDLVGDDYNAAAPAGSPQLIPHPDSNPLDCNGHGSHVAGTAAGNGITGAGATYFGPYNSAAYTPGAFRIGPGVAPKADIYSVRVFGCTGSTDVVAEAIDWAVAHGMDVISMSLGSNFGATSTAESESVANAALAGVLVVAASGNAGPIPYITSAPATGEGAIAVAATDALAAIPVDTLTLDNGKVLTVQNSNGAVVTPATWPVVVLRNADGTVSRGCNEAEYDKTRNGGIDLNGKLVITTRGVCARVFRAGAAQKYGAAAAAMINTAAGFPVYEGPIPGNDPATNPFAPVTIPFLGIQLSDKANAIGAPAATPPIAVPTSAGIVPASPIANPGFEKIASFSSAGPRIGDSVLKPNVTAPGVSTVSTASGTGNGFVIESGTSMATPHVAGVAALVKQSHPNWSIDELRSAVVQTASPAKMKDYNPRNEGAGLVQAVAAVNTQVVAALHNDSLSFGYADLLRDFRGHSEFSLRNHGKASVKFNVTVTQVSTGPGVTLSAPTTVTVGPRGDRDVQVTLTVPAGAVGATHDAAGNGLFWDISGYLTLTPASADANNGVSLTIPYYLVPRTRSNGYAFTEQELGPSHPTSKIYATNFLGQIASTPDFYSVGLVQKQPQGIQFADTRVVGVQSFPLSPTDAFLVFAINTFSRFSNAASFLEWDVLIDSTGTGNPNFVLIGINGSSVSSNAAVANVPVAALLNLATGRITALRFADAPTDQSTILLAVKASEIGVTAANPRFTYAEQHFDATGAGAAMPGLGIYNPFTPALSVSFPDGTVAPNQFAVGTVTVDPVEWPLSTPGGILIINQDNVNGARQGQILRPGGDD